MQLYDLTIRDIIPWLAVTSSFMVYAAGSKTCFNIIRTKTTGDVTLFPFIASFYSGVVWLKYGLLTNLTTLVVASGANTTCQFIYIVIYYMYTRDRRRCTKVLSVAFPIIYLLLFYVKYIAGDKEGAAKLGIIGAGTTITMCASPLVSLVDVIKLKSTKMLDFGFIVANFISSALWTYLGFLVRDFYVMIPNGIGLSFTIIQLSLFILYPTPSSKTKTPEKLSQNRSEGT